jgi:DnaJ-class molecular chaperone
VFKKGYQRRGDDLVVTHTCTLQEALAMNPVSIETLDNRTVFVTPQEIVSPQTECVVPCEGMPCAPSGDIVADTTTLLEKKLVQQRGNLVVKFNIEFPKRILTEHRQAMIAALKDNCVA